MNTFSSDFLSKLRYLETHLKANIKGQDHVLPRICSVLRRRELNLAHPNRPKGSFPFVGPTGVGKTEIILATGETRSVNGYYIVFTSNIGAAEAMRMESSAFATIETLVREGFHRTLGARPMRNTVDRFLQMEVVESILRQYGIGNATASLNQKE